MRSLRKEGEKSNGHLTPINHEDTDRLKRLAKHLRDDAPLSLDGADRTWLADLLDMVKNRPVYHRPKLGRFEYKRRKKIALYVLLLRRTGKARNANEAEICAAEISNLKHETIKKICKKRSKFLTMLYGEPFDILAGPLDADAPTRNRDDLKAMDDLERWIKEGSK